MRHVKVLGGLALIATLGATAYWVSKSPFPPASSTAPSAVPSAVPAVGVSVAPALFVDVGGTIGECATYGKWWTEGPLTVYAAERDTSRVAYTLKAHEGFTAETGNVITTAYGTAIAPPGASAYTEAGQQVPMAVGEKLQLIHYVGEGAWAVRRNGRTEQVDLSMVMADAKGFKRPEVEWWAQVRNREGQVGYLPVDRAKRLYGVDGCGGPPPAWAK